MNNFSKTIKFKDIYASFEDFKNDLTIIDNIDKILFNYIYNYYCNSNIRYETIDAFKRHFVMEYENESTRFKMQLSMMDKIYNLSEDDVIMIENGINNVANNDNSLVENPFKEIIKFITNQSTYQRNSNRFIALINYVNELKNKQIFDFLDNFKKHFLSVIL